MPAPPDSILRVAAWLYIQMNDCVAVFPVGCNTQYDGAMDGEKADITVQGQNADSAIQQFARMPGHGRLPERKYETHSA